MLPRPPGAGKFFFFLFVFFQIKGALYCAAAINVLRRNFRAPVGLFAIVTGRYGDRTMSFEIRKVGVIGAGQMGKGIAQVCALAGYDLALNDVSPERVDAAVKDIAVQMRKSAERGHLSAEAVDVAMPRISGAPQMQNLGDADLIIEAATENEEVKRAILTEVAQIARPEAIIASNTSSISITRLAAITGRPERFIGIHFMNPVPRMQLVELIRGIATEDNTFEAAREFCARLGKTVTVAEDFPAFIVNRILLPMINEAIYTLYEGVGSVEAIDTAMRLGANHPMGPLQLADFIGLDTCLSVMQVLHEGLADTKYRPCPLLVKYVEAGWLGKKTQRGFYDYRSGSPVPTR
jgi:3-hydroxybutyryl-CoA dehydrogenase